MIKILLVEDDQEKRRLVTQVLLRIDGVTDQAIDIATDVHAGKISISKKKYDLLILDICLPRRSDQLPDSDAGLDILTFIRDHPRAIAPSYIVGLTAFGQSAELASHAFSSALWKLIFFSHSDTEWQRPIIEAVSYLLLKHHPPHQSDGSTYHVDLGVVAALPEELEQILRLPGQWSEIHVPYDMSVYHKGVFAGPNGTLSVVAVAAQRMGMPAAAVVTANFIAAFRPRYIAMIGICAGVRGKVEFGDILMADPCFDWGSGKWLVEKGELRFRPAPYPWRLNTHLAAAAKRAAKPDVLARIHGRYNGNKPRAAPMLVVDAMASGGSVLQAQKLVDEVREQHKNLVGIEMESYAFFTAAEFASAPKPICFSMKSVCDFGDDKKDDSYHRYAAYTSAEFLHAFVTTELLVPTDVL